MLSDFTYDGPSESVVEPLLISRSREITKYSNFHLTFTLYCELEVQVIGDMDISISPR